MITMDGTLAQKINYQTLEAEIYTLNNQFKHSEAQEKLFAHLEEKGMSAIDKYHLYLLLSFTYKRVFDYQTTLAYLTKAEEQAQLTNQLDSCVAVIRAQKALALFDIQEYIQADEVMKKLRANHYHYIDDENVSKIRMQEGYIKYLNKSYQEAEKIYNEAITLMTHSSVCDLPMILVKKMQLYGELDELDKLEEIYRQSVAKADSCGILKYHMYAAEEASKIFKQRKDAQRSLRYQLELDSLKKVYDTEKHLAELHLAKSAHKDELVTKQQMKNQHLVIIIILLILGILLISSMYYQNYKKKQILEIEFQCIHEELQHYIDLMNKSKKNNVELQVTALTKRQSEVYELLKQGKSNREIANELFISENTVKFHIKNIYNVLNVKHRVELLQSA